MPCLALPNVFLSPFGVQSSPAQAKQSKANPYYQTVVQYFVFTLTLLPHTFAHLRLDNCNIHPSPIHYTARPTNKQDGQAPRPPNPATPTQVNWQSRVQGSQRYPRLCPFPLAACNLLQSSSVSSFQLQFLLHCSAPLRRCSSCGTLRRASPQSPSIDPVLSCLVQSTRACCCQFFLQRAITPRGISSARIPSRRPSAHCSTPTVSLVETTLPCLTYHGHLLRASLLSPSRPPRKTGKETKKINKK